MTPTIRSINLTNGVRLQYAEQGDAAGMPVPAAIWRDAFAALFDDDDFAAELRRIAVPTLVVWGDRDNFCPQSDQELIVQAITGSRLLTYEGSGHALHWEQPARFADDLANFAKALTQ